MQNIHYPNTKRTWRVSYNKIFSHTLVSNKQFPDWNFHLGQGINPPRTSTIGRGCSRAISIKMIHLAAMMNAAVFLLNVHLNVTYCIFMVISLSHGNFFICAFCRCAIFIDVKRIPCASSKDSNLGEFSVSFTTSP